MWAAFTGAVLVGLLAGTMLRKEPAANRPVESAPGPAAGAPRAPRAAELRPLRRPVFAAELALDTQARLGELEALAISDPLKALAALEAFRGKEVFSHALTALARGWATMDPVAAASWVAGLDTADERISATLGLVPVWAGKDPGACLDWANACPPGALREVSLVELADTWVVKQPRAALERFSSLPEDEGRERGLHVITAQWVLDDPTSAIAHLAGLDATQRRDEFLETALVSLSNMDPDRTWNEAGRFQNPEQAAHVRCMALEAMAEERPQDALKLAESAGNPASMLRAVARGWASWDPESAGKWISSLDDSQLVDDLRQEIAD